MYILDILNILENIKTIETVIIQTMQGCKTIFLLFTTRKSPKNYFYLTFYI